MHPLPSDGVLWAMLRPQSVTRGASAVCLGTPPPLNARAPLQLKSA